MRSDGELPHWLRALYRKVGIPGWEAYIWERVGNTYDVICTGCVPNGVYSKGPRKGRPRYKDGTQDGKYVLTSAEVEAERIRWESETGKCGECYGRGEVLAGWNKDEGKRYRPCPKCNRAEKAA